VRIAARSGRGRFRRSETQRLEAKPPYLLVVGVVGGAKFREGF